MSRRIAIALPWRLLLILSKQRFLDSTISSKGKRYGQHSTMNATTSPHNIVTGTQASSQPQSLAASPALDADMAAVSSVSFGMSTAAANNATMAQNQPAPTAAAFSTPSLVRDGTPSADADSSHLLRSATLYASPDLVALTAIATTTSTSTTNNNNNVAPSTVEDTTSAANTATNMVSMSNPFGSSMANYAPGAGQLQQGGQHQPGLNLNHPGAPFSLTVAAINASQVQVQAPTGLQMAAMAAASNSNATAATTLPVGDGNTTGFSRVYEGASRPFTQEEKDATRCSCQKTRCLKLYCECFQSGAECKDECNCKSCGNLASNPKRQGIIDEILARKPEAFMLRAVPKTDIGCRCKRSRCLKLYCVCFKAGKNCGDECICTDCANVTTCGEDDDAKPEAVSIDILEAAPKPITPTTSRDPPQMMHDPLCAFACLCFIALVFVLSIWRF